jgi:CcmD family protein
MRPVVRVLLVILLSAAPLFAQQPPPKPTAAQDGFVPVDTPTNQQETIPAARLVGIAYGFIWVVLLGYVWSVRSRLSRVEHEMDALVRRTGSTRP